MNTDTVALLDSLSRVYQESQTIACDNTYSEFIDYIERDILRAHHLDNIHHHHPRSWKNGKVYYTREIIASMRFLINELVLYTPPAPVANVYLSLLRSVSRIFPNLPTQEHIQFLDLMPPEITLYIESYREILKLFLNNTNDYQINLPNNIGSV